MVMMGYSLSRKATKSVQYGDVRCELIRFCAGPETIAYEMNMWMVLETGSNGLNLKPTKAQYEHFSKAVQIINDTLCDDCFTEATGPQGFCTYKANFNLNLGQYRRALKVARNALLISKLEL